MSQNRREIAGLAGGLEWIWNGINTTPNTKNQKKPKLNHAHPNSSILKFKMVQRFLFSVMLLICTSAYSQRELSRQAIDELVTKTSGFLGLESNKELKTALDKYLTTYSRLGTSAAMANFKKDINNRRDLLLFMERATSNRESLGQMLTAINATPKTSQEMLEYFFPKNVVARPAVKPDTSRVLRESTNVKPPEPATLQPPSKKFFDGRKTFCDSLGTSYYSVIIIKGNILLNKYSGKPNDKMSAPLTKSKAILSGENILSPETHVVNFRYENNTLYEKADEFGRWIRYVECK